MDLDFDYAAARRAGYSDDDILNGLQQSGRVDFDLKAARDAGYSSGDILQGMFSGQQPRAPAPAPEPSSLLRRAGDIGVSAIRGAIAVPEALVGLADIPTGGAVGRAAEALGFDFKGAKEGFGTLYSPEQQAANQRVAEAQGFLPTIGAMVQNPSTILQTAVESAPSMIGGAGIGRAALSLAPRIGAAAAGAIGEGAIGAGSAAEQIRQASGGDLSLGQSGAALGSGILTGAFSLTGGRIAQKLGIGDIDTALVQAGAPAGSSKGVIRRLVEGGVSEGVFEEMPQSIQEQMWQNAALDRPLLEGVPQSAAQGLIAGGLFGGVAGAALNRTVAPGPEGEFATGETPLLPYSPDPFISFPDGSVGRQSDADAFINGLPEDQRNAARARLYGLEPQPINPDDILQAQSVDDAIALATRAIDEGTPEFRELRNSQIDVAWNQYLGERAGSRWVEFEAAQAQTRAAEEAVMQEQLQDQAVDQANAITEAQGFDQPEPTAMQLAMQRARAAAQPQEIADVARPAAGLRNVSMEGAENLAPLQPSSTPGLPIAGELPGSATAIPATAERLAGEGLVDAVTPVTAPALSRVTGRQIDRDWTEFSPEAVSLNIPRGEMPQIRASARGPMVNFLNARGITHETMEVPAGELLPTQREFSPAKVQQARDFEGRDRSILISSDNRILDGHHQWLAKLDANEPVKVIRLNAPIEQLLEQVKEFPSAETAEGAAPQTAPQNIPETIPVAEAEDDASDIPVAFMRRVKVPVEVWVQDEGQYETVDMPADRALASVREDIADLRALLNCLRS